MMAWMAVVVYSVLCAVVAWSVWTAPYGEEDE